MVFQRLYLDCRNRTENSTPSRARFNLSRPLKGVTRYQIKSISLVNTYHNITSDNNTVTTSGGSFSLDQGFYSAVQLIDVLDASLGQIYGASAPGFVTLNSDNTLNWSLGTNSIITSGSTMSHVLGLDPNQASYTGSFTSQLFLALPQYISVSCPQLSPINSMNLHTGEESIAVFPITAGYLESMNVFPEQTIMLNSSRAGLNVATLDIAFNDPYSGRELRESAVWSMVIEFN
jgi:hypothetical protein